MNKPLVNHRKQLFSYIHYSIIMFGLALIAASSAWRYFGSGLFNNLAQERFFSDNQLAISAWLDLPCWLFLVLGSSFFCIGLAGELLISAVPLLVSISNVKRKKETNSSLKRTDI